MCMTEENIIQIIRDQFLGTITPEDQLKLEAWLKDSDEHVLLFEKIKKDIRCSSESAVYNSLNNEEAWLKFKTTISYKKRRVFIRRLLGYVAAVALPMLVITAYFFIVPDRQPCVTSDAVSRINPGSSRAILISAAGKTYELEDEREFEELEVSEGIIVKQAGGNLIYDSVACPAGNVSPMMNTLKIPRGGEFKITFADGTTVHVNSASELRYPVSFEKHERKVYLSGEAYFEVAKDVDRPFYVLTDDVRIRVYGTEFNVNTHSAEYVQTVLVSGKVGIKPIGDKNEIVMNPGELADFDRNTKEFEIAKVDIRQYVAWKDGYFAFENETLERIMNTLSLWYDVDVFFQSESVKGLLFTGYMKRYEQIEDILNAITDVVNVQFTVNERTIIIAE